MTKHHLPLHERFQQYCLILQNGCWYWTGQKCPKGYGRLRVEGKTTKAHRLSYELHHGPIPPGISVLHRCDYPSCVNPAHLFLGTNQDNVEDKVRKGRSRFTGRSIVQSWAQKLTEDTVRQIRSDTRDAKEVAEALGVNVSTIHRVRSRKTWNYLE